jgi:hypothetical protein
VSANPFAKSALLILLTASGTLAQEPTPLEKYERLRKGFSNSGYSTGEIDVIAIIAAQIYALSHCPPEEGRDSNTLAYFVEVTSRGLTHSKDEIELRARDSCRQWPRFLPPIRLKRLISAAPQQSRKTSRSDR